MKAHSLMAILAFASFGITAGCGIATDGQTAALATNVSMDGKQYLLNEEPDGAVGVIAARESAEDGKPLILVGRIGGAANPWIDGRAAFTVLDASMTVVATGEEAEGAICTDDCCATERLACTAVVKVIDADGKLIPIDSRQLLGVKESDMVVAEGKAQKDKNGNFVMLAHRIYIRR